MDDLPIVSQRDVPGLIQGPCVSSTVIVPVVPADRDRAFAAHRGDMIARNAEHHRLHLAAGHLFRLLDGLADGGGGLFGIDDNPAAQTLRRHPARADDAQIAVRVRFGDQGADLGRAHINRTDQLVRNRGFVAACRIGSKTE